MITIQTGERLSRVIPVLDAAFAPVLVTSGWSARVQVRPSPRSGEVVHEWTTAGPGANAELVTGTAGAVRITASADETADWQATWPAGAQHWDMRLVDASGEVHILDLGRVALDTHVTR